MQNIQAATVAWSKAERRGIARRIMLIGGFRRIWSRDSKANLVLMEFCLQILLEDGISASHSYWAVIGVLQWTVPDNNIHHPCGTCTILFAGLSIKRRK